MPPEVLLLLQKKILDEKGIAAKDVKGSGKDGRVTKEDAVQAKASMGTPGTGKRGESRKKNVHVPS